ncbi:19847_t:CDS:2 [Funneliformis geosporum]|uniref:6091_t:CDS:1 n=1 Tax=Funneliformis geosporum TaxID=1117311 RepID=A0A9W4SGT6_9GLOM|nr:6091_t:CDS:2 [Funneliformis geosporum]CAI2172328.1 19847_t:CDS:2 [Funneliformis geosporum]
MPRRPSKKVQEKSRQRGIAYREKMKARRRSIEQQHANLLRTLEEAENSRLDMADRVSYRSAEAIDARDSNIQFREDIEDLQWVNIDRQQHPPSQNPEETLDIKEYKSMNQLPKGSLIGTRIVTRFFEL